MTTPQPTQADMDAVKAFHYEVAEDVLGPPECVCGHSMERRLLTGCPAGDRLALAFAKRAAEEREACAQIAEATPGVRVLGLRPYVPYRSGAEIAALIRARGEGEPRG